MNFGSIFSADIWMTERGVKNRENWGNITYGCYLMNWTTPLNDNWVNTMLNPLAPIAVLIHPSIISIEKNNVLHLWSKLRATSIALFLSPYGLKYFSLVLFFQCQKSFLTWNKLYQLVQQYHFSYYYILSSI